MKIIILLLILALASALGGFIVMWLWNALASYFGFMTITFRIAWLINIALALVSSCFRGGK